MMVGETELDDLLGAAARVRMVPDDALMARVLADAEALQPAPPLALPLRATPRRPGLWPRLAAALGGAGALAGLGTAVVAGLAVGLVQPDAVSLVTGGYLAINAVEAGPDAALFPDMTLFLVEDQG